MLRNVTNFFKFYYLPIISGLLIGLSYIPLPPWALFFGFAPLWHFCLKNSFRLKSLVLAGWLFQFIFSLIGFYWIAYTVHVYGQMNWIVSVFVLLLFCSLAHLHIPLSIFIWSLLIRLKFFGQKWAQWLLLPTLTAMSMAWVPMLFKWDFGVTWLWARLPVFHTAEIWGFQFLSTLTLFAQLIFLSLRTKDLFKKLFPLGLIIFLFLNMFGYMMGQIQPQEDQKTNILMVQHNVGNYIHYSGRIEGAFNKTVRKLMTLSQKELKNKDVDFVLWAEGAYPYLISQKRLPFQYEFLKRRVRDQLKVPLVTGGSAIVEKALTNSIFFINEFGDFTPARYDKNHLLAFGEYIPGDRWFPRLRKYFLGSHRAFMAGKEGPTVRKVRETHLGLQICYEGLRPNLSRTLTEKGAQILVNVTNESWFGKWSQPHQHLYLTLARSIENRLPIVRLSTVGYSVVMSANGKILTESPLHQEWTQVVTVPYFSKPRQTIFVRWGRHIHWVFLIIIFLLPVFVNVIGSIKPFNKYKKIIQK